MVWFRMIARKNKRFEFADLPMWSCRWSVFVFFFSSERINTDKIVLDNTAYKLPTLQWPQHSRNYDQETCIWDTDYPLKNILLSGVSVERPTFYLNVTKPWTLHYFFSSVFQLILKVNYLPVLIGVRSPHMPQVTSVSPCYPRELWSYQIPLHSSAKALLISYSREKKKKKSTAKHSKVKVRKKKKSP